MCIKINVPVRWKLWNYVISGYHSNVLLKITMLHELRYTVGHERGSSILFQCRVYSVSADNILMCMCSVAQNIKETV
jgi:hypothetical protein